MNNERIIDGGVAVTHRCSFVFLEKKSSFLKKLGNLYEIHKNGEKFQISPRFCLFRAENTEFFETEQFAKKNE